MWGKVFVLSQYGPLKKKKTKEALDIESRYHMVTNSNKYVQWILFLKISKDTKTLCFFS